MFDKSAQPPSKPSQTHDWGIHLDLSSWQEKVLEGQAPERMIREEFTTLNSFSILFLWNLTAKLDWLEFVRTGLRLEGPKIGSTDFRVKLKGNWEADIDVNNNCKGIISIPILTPMLPCPLS